MWHLLQIAQKMLFHCHNLTMNMQCLQKTATWIHALRACKPTLLILNSLKKRKMKTNLHINFLQTKKLLLRYFEICIKAEALESKKYQCYSSVGKNENWTYIWFIIRHFFGCKGSWIIKRLAADGNFDKLTKHVDSTET